MKRRLAVLGVLVLQVVAADRVRADGLELRIVSASSASYVDVDTSGTTVPVYIQGRLVGEDFAGLALWYADVHSFGSVNVDLRSSDFLLECPAALANYFDRDDGFCNLPGPMPGPTGYGGTDAGVPHTLWQVGGAQNSMGNSPPPTYPVGNVLMGVCTNGWETLAEGEVTFNGAVGETIALELKNSAATVFDQGQMGPVYDVSKVNAVDVVEGPLVIKRTVPLVAAQSVGYHAFASTNGWLGGDIAFDVAIDTTVNTAGLSECRQFNVSNELLWINLVFAEAIDAADVFATVTPDPGTSYTLTQGASANEVELRWGSGLVIDLDSAGGGPQYQYRIALSGHASGELEIGYITGDIDCNRSVNGLDIGVIVRADIWQHDICDATLVRPDVSRDGKVNGLDIAVVTNTPHWQKPPPTSPPLSVACPAEPDITCP